MVTVLQYFILPSLEGILHPNRKEHLYINYFIGPVFSKKSRLHGVSFSDTNDDFVGEVIYLSWLKFNIADIKT